MMMTYGFSAQAMYVEETKSTTHLPFPVPKAKPPRAKSAFSKQENQIDLREAKDGDNLQTKTKTIDSKHRAYRLFSVPVTKRNRQAQAGQSQFAPKTSTKVQKDMQSDSDD